MGTILTDLPDLARHCLVKAMDSRTRAAFRLTCKQAQHDVYAVTSRLTWATPIDASVACLIPDWMLVKMRKSAHCCDHSNSATLVAKCPQLKGLVAKDLPYQLHLTALTVLPAGLQHLDLSGAHITRKDLFRIGSASALQELHMTRCGLRQFDPIVLTAMLQSLRCLRLLNLAACQLQIEGAQMLAGALPSTSATLQHLDLQQNEFDDSAAETLAPALSSLVHLTTLKLGNNALGDEAIAALSTSICTLTRLHHLDLDNNYYGSDCVEDLACMMAPLRELRSFNIWNSYISLLKLEGLRTLAPVLARLPNMEELKLTGIWAVDVVREIVCMMRGQPNLTSVHLVTAGMDENSEEQAAALAQAISSLVHLKTLHLRPALYAPDPKSYTAPGALLILINAIAPLTQLERLSLAHYRLGRTATVALAELATNVLPRLQRLTHLNLNSNALGYEGAVMLAPSLGSLCQLRELSLDDNEFRGAAVEVLAAVVRGLPNLRQLNLGGTYVGEHALSDMFLKVNQWK